eukprot:6203566-Pleurochrysis_carterae.AAC.1
MVIKSNNGAAFCNMLIGKFAEYAGLMRRTFVFPYDAPANGMAELSSQWRVSLACWLATRSSLDTLPVVTFALHCTEHLSTSMSGFFRSLWSTPRLASGVGEPFSGRSGNEFVNMLATRSRQAWLVARNTSESIRLDAAARSDARHRRWLSLTPWVM